MRGTGECVLTHSARIDVDRILALCEFSRMDIGAIINSADISVADLARKMGVSDGHLCDLKSGRRRLTVEMAAKLEAALNRPGIVDSVLASMRRDALGSSLRPEAA